MDEGTSITVSADDVLNLFNELTSKNQNLIIKQGLRKSGKIILDQAKSNLSSQISGTSSGRTMKSFKMADIKTSNSVVGVEIGNSWYKSRFLEGGTVDRITKNKRKRKAHPTGKMKALHFLEDATTQKGQEALDELGNNIQIAFDRLVRKYSKEK